MREPVKLLFLHVHVVHWTFLTKKHLVDCWKLLKKHVGRYIQDSVEGKHNDVFSLYTLNSGFCKQSP